MGKTVAAVKAPPVAKHPPLAKAPAEVKPPKPQPKNKQAPLMKPSDRPPAAEEPSVSGGSRRSSVVSRDPPPAAMSSSGGADHPVSHASPSIAAPKAPTPAASHNRPATPSTLEPPSPAAAGPQPQAAQQRSEADHSGERRPTLGVAVVERQRTVMAPSAKDLYTFLDHCRKKYKEGQKISKVTKHGTLATRWVYLNAKPEYFEISSARLFDSGFHLLELKAVKLGDDSREFRLCRTTKDGDPEKLPANQCCVVGFTDKTISLIFKTHADRNEFAYLLGVSRQAVVQWYESSGGFMGNHPPRPSVARTTTMPEYMGHRPKSERSMMEPAPLDTAPSKEMKSLAAPQTSGVMQSFEEDK